MNEIKTYWWKSPYNFREKIDFLKYRWLSPKKPDGTVVFPHHLQRVGRSVNGGEREGRKISLLFTGDLMPFGNHPPTHSDGLDAFLSSADYIVFNLEGIVTAQTRALALSHHPTALIEYLKGFQSKDTIKGIILNVANNHASDFGAEVFERQNADLRSAGFLVVGDQNSPLCIEDKLTLSAATFLSNQSAVIKTHTIDKLLAEEITIPPKETYNIFMPHWGYEMHLQPLQKQVDLYQDLISVGYDSVIGNHSHSAQAVYAADQSIFASSLGNYCYLNNNPNHWMGTLLKCTFTMDDSGDKPILSQIETRHIQQKVVDRTIRLDLTECIDYDALRKAGITYNWDYIKDLLK
ncbi:MAG: CapA family protein [Porphyromonas sp.]|nr:CapA family protein [Porphyromonas sp.]